MSRRLTIFVLSSRRLLVALVGRDLARSYTLRATAHCTPYNRTGHATHILARIPFDLSPSCSVVCAHRLPPAHRYSNPTWSPLVLARLISLLVMRLSYPRHLFLSLLLLHLLVVCRPSASANGSLLLKPHADSHGNPSSLKRLQPVIAPPGSPVLLYCPAFVP